VTPGTTSTGAVLEAMVLPALHRAGYECRGQAVIGLRIGGRKHRVDVLATKGTYRVLVSLKWQQTSGTAEQKVPFEVICLSDAIRAGVADAAYLVLGGNGWTLREFYTRGGLSRYLADAERVIILTLEDFVARANRGRL
jgi:hypothetical protein